MRLDTDSDPAGGLLSLPQDSLPSLPHRKTLQMISPVDVLWATKILDLPDGVAWVRRSRATFQSQLRTRSESNFNQE
jgi:hypothetical protein